MNYFIYLVTLLVSAQCFAATGYGFCSYGKETISSVECYGPTQLADTTINGSVSVAGPLTANNSTMQSMNVKGVANLTNSQIKSNVQIKGFLTAKNATFSGDILLTSNEAVFTNSTIKGSMTIQSDRQPTITLRCGTRILGNITFQGAVGIIHKSKDSTIKGKITQGTIQEITDDKCN